MRTHFMMQTKIKLLIFRSGGLWNIKYATQFLKIVMSLLTTNLLVVFALYHRRFSYEATFNSRPGGHTHLGGDFDPRHGRMPKHDSMPANRGRQLQLLSDRDIRSTIHVPRRMGCPRQPMLPGRNPFIGQHRIHRNNIRHMRRNGGRLCPMLQSPMRNPDSKLQAFITGVLEMKKFVFCAIMACISGAAYGACTTAGTTYYACKPGYYLSSGNCVRCPSSSDGYGTTTDTNTGGRTSCYVPSGTTGSDGSGSYTYMANCHYVE